MSVSASICRLTPFAKLTELGLGDALEKAGIPTKELAYYDPAVS